MKTAKERAIEVIHADTDDPEFTVIHAGYDASMVPEQSEKFVVEFVGAIQKRIATSLEDHAKEAVERERWDWYVAVMQFMEARGGNDGEGDPIEESKAVRKLLKLCGRPNVKP